jgi:hypothetical protein
VSGRAAVFVPAGGRGGLEQELARLIAVRSFMIETRIASTRARVADPSALNRLLDEVPGGDEIRHELFRPYFTRRWQQSMQRSFWIASDGTTVTCLTVSGLDVNEMVAVWLTFDDYRRRPGFTLSACSLGEIIRAELGIAAEID